MNVMTPKEIASAQEVIDSYDVDAKKAMQLINERAKDTSAPFKAYDAAHAICSALQPW